MKGEKGKVEDTQKTNVPFGNGMEVHSSNFLKDIRVSAGILLFVIFIVLFFVFYSGFHEVEAYPSCGDGTLENYCSLYKPYFCSGKVLSENSVRCGCPEFFSFNEKYCVSDYENQTEDRYYNYTLNGANEEFYFKYRPEVLNSLLSLPRFKTYSENETPRRDDFTIPKIENSLQRNYLVPLVVSIENRYPDSKDMQAKAAISLVQEIPYNESNFEKLFGVGVRVSRYPYQVLGENQGSCEGKSELMAFLLKELGFGVVLFYFPNENHEAVGIKCPIEYSYNKTGYCFVETTVSSPISYSTGEYLVSGGVGRTLGAFQIIKVSEGISLSQNIDDYKDSKTLDYIVKKISRAGSLNFLDKPKMDSLREKYGLIY